jgi:hypothetical protein
MTDRRTHRIRLDARLALVVALSVALWLLASLPTGLALHQLVVFAAPGALLGLGASWAANASEPSRWTWQSGRWGVLWGALVLPPFIALLIALDGQARPHQLVIGFVRSAWLAFALGLAMAAARAVRSEKRREQIRGRLEQPFPARPGEESLEDHLVSVAQVGEEYLIKPRGDE